MLTLIIESWQAFLLCSSVTFWTEASPHGQVVVCNRESAPNIQVCKYEFPFYTGEGFVRANCPGLLANGFESAPAKPDPDGCLNCD